VEINAESWERHSFDAADVKSLYPQWRSTVEITQEGEAMARRHVELFKAAKQTKKAEDHTTGTTRSGYTPPEFLGRISEEKEDS
jgi:hypothetical protein